MPLFKWVACDQAGTVCKGNMYAREVEEVRYQLNKNGRQLLSALIVNQGNHLGHYQKARLCEDIALLLDARMPIAELFAHLAQSNNHAYSQYMLRDISEGLKSGNALSSMFCYYTTVWTENDCTLVAASEKSGDLKTVFRQLATYYYERDHFLKTVKSAISQPVVTFVFFMSLVFFFLLAIVPRFKIIFQRFEHAQLPYLTRMVFYISELVQLPLVWVGVVFFGIGYFVYRRQQYAKADEKLLFWVTTIPGLSQIGLWYSLFRFYKTLGNLIAAKVPLLQACTHAGRAITGDTMQHEFQIIMHDITAGTSLSKAFGQHPELCDATIVGLLKIGEKSTDLVRSFEYAAQFYKQKINDRLRYITTSVQPILMISLGALVVLFVIAVYAPLFTFASLISNYQ